MNVKINFLMKNKIFFFNYNKKKPLKNPEDLNLVSNLILKIFPEYYKCFKTSDHKLKKIITKLLFIKNSEFEKLYVMKLGNSLIGIATIIKSKKLKVSKTLGFLKMVDSLGIENVDKRKVIKLSKSFSKIESSKPYLTRFGINPNYRGKRNYSSIFMNYVLKKQKKKLIAHVNKYNKRALNFYLKNNFKIIDRRKSFYLIEYKV
tara:strand:- start:1162 stop:1773 length:612 start_codon:yes stop_codon:yes gene_type:complete